MKKEMSGEDVRAWREKKRLTQADLARRLPVNVRTLQEWESGRGKGNPPPFIKRALNDLDREMKEERK